MFIVILTWLYIAIISLILGVTFNKLWWRITGFTMESFEMYILTGLAILTIYAQIFSLFSGVGAGANILLIVVCIMLLAFTKRDMAMPFKKLNAQWWPLKAFIVLIVTGVVAVFASQPPSHYDTYLYHAQAIRWIEEYGVVPGLGNLHSRFAYNSSFLVVQALFSLKFIYGISLHTLNGFISAIFLMYGLFSFKLIKDRKLGISDGLRLVLILYIVRELPTVSSPNTDTFALGLAAYIFTKWSVYLETEDQRIEPYGWLCLMGIFACTLKLSSAFIMILLIKPVYLLIKSRRWKEFGCYALSGFIIVLPFVIRNVMASGYILYPYAGIDVIPFIDWKMDPAMAEYDRKEIMVWGRGTFNVAATYDWSVFQWLPIWFKSIGRFYQICFLGAVVSSTGLIISNCYFIVKRKFDYILLSMASVICLLGWLFTAPLVRYGAIYMWIPCCILFLYWMDKWKISRIAGKLGLLAGVCVVLYFSRINMSYLLGASFLNLYDYNYIECVPRQWNGGGGGMTVYGPAQGDQTGYFYFPSTPNLDQLLNIELRTDSLKDGFRIKQGG